MNDAFLSEVLRLSNLFRAQNGLAPLLANLELDKAAQSHSESMAQQDFFDHTSQDGKQPWDRAKDAGYDYNAIAENIAAGQRSPEEVVNGWINSPGHRANLLNPTYTDLGVGYFNLDNDTGSVNYNTYWTQLFGSGDSQPAPAPGPNLPMVTPAPTPVMDMPMDEGTTTDPADTPVVDTPAVDEVVVEAPAVEAPVADTPVMDMPMNGGTTFESVDTPSVDAPTTNTGEIDSPGTTGTMNGMDMNGMGEMPHSPTHAALENLIVGATPTHKAIKDGAWSDPSTWDNGRVPGDNANVLISEGTAVTYDQVSEARLKTIAIEGNLQFAANQDTQLYVETILNSEDGKLDIGSETQSVGVNNRARIIFTSDSKIDSQWDPTQLSKGLVSHGEINIFGADKLDKIELVGDATAGNNVLTFKEAPTGWQVGDKVVLGGTDYGWNGNDQDNSRSQDEVLTITNISGNEIRFVNDDIKTGDRNVLRFDHTRSELAESSETSLYAANITRNISFETENGKEVPIDQRAHVMLMDNPNIKVFNAGFYDLGRSDKTKLVDDIGENVDGSQGNGTNIRGRYALHLHKAGDLADPNGVTPLLKGNAISGSPGWGLVQHESRAGLEDNVVFDVAGAGIVAESGNETGWWTNNTVIKSTGINWQVAEDQRDAREGKFDLGYEGQGFWVQGAGMVKNSGNTAISSNSTGMTLFGSVISENEAYRPVKSVLISQLSPELQQLFPKEQTEVDIRDIPMATVEGFEAYNNTTGLQVWGHKTNFDGELAFSNNSMGDDPNKLPDTAHLGRSEVKDFKLWGSRWAGARADYSSNIDLKNGLILGGRGGNDRVSGGSGLFSNHATFNSVYDNLTIAGFKQGAQVEYPNSDKDFIATTLKNSTFRDNTYNLGAVGDEDIREERPDDFGAFMKLQNNQFEAVENNRAPVASFRTQAIGGLAVTLDASASSDADPLLPEDGTPRALPSNGIAAYAWDVDNNGTLDRFGRTLDQVFDKAGSREISLTVLDNQGQATTLKQTIDVQPTAYINAFEGGSFDDNALKQLPWKSSSEYSDEGWYLTDGSQIANGAAQLSRPGEWGGFVGQVTRNEKVHRGDQTLSFRMKNIEGAPEQNVWEKNEVTVTLWGVNGQFANNAWEKTGPTQVGTLPMERTALVSKVYGGKEGAATDFFDWKNISMDVDLGQGYDYLMFQVNTAATRDANDLVAIDDVSLSGAANSIPGELIPPNTLTPPPTFTANPTPRPLPTPPTDGPIEVPPTGGPIEVPPTNGPVNSPNPLTEGSTDGPVPAPPAPVPAPTIGGGNVPPAVDSPGVDSPSVDPVGAPMDMAAPITQMSFEEALGRIAKDTATEGIANNAKLYGGAQWAEGKVGGAIALDGENDLVMLNSSKDMNLGKSLDQRTVSMWFKADDVSSEQEQVIFEEGGMNRGLNMYLEDNLLYFGGWSGAENDYQGDWVSTDQVESGKWHHAAFVLDAQAGGEKDTLTAYLDGELVGQAEASPLLAHPDPIGLGNVAMTTRFENGYGFLGNSGLAGSIDEVKIFNDALNPSQIGGLAMV